MTQKAESQENYGGPAELRRQTAEFEAAERTEISKEMDRKKLPRKGMDTCKNPQEIRG